MKIATRINEAVKTSTLKEIAKEFFDWVQDNAEEFLNLSIRGKATYDKKSEEIKTDSIEISEIKFIHDKNLKDDLEESGLLKDYKLSISDFDDKTLSDFAKELDSKVISIRYHFKEIDMDGDISIKLSKVEYDAKKIALIIKKFELDDIQF